MDAITGPIWGTQLRDRHPVPADQLVPELAAAKRKLALAQDHIQALMEAIARFGPNPEWTPEAIGLEPHGDDTWGTPGIAARARIHTNSYGRTQIMPVAPSGRPMETDWQPANRISARRFLWPWSGLDAAACEQRADRAARHKTLKSQWLAQQRYHVPDINGSAIGLTIDRPAELGAHGRASICLARVIPAKSMMLTSGREAVNLPPRFIRDVDPTGEDWAVYIRHRDCEEAAEWAHASRLSHKIT